MPRGTNKEQILTAGLDLMYAKGFAAVGIQEIADASGVPKGSFYNYFRSKEDFVIAALARYTDEMSAFLEDALLEGRGSPLGRLRRMLGTWAKKDFLGHGARGCFAGNLSQELANHSPAIRRALRRSFDTLESYYASCLEDARSAGELPEDSDPRQLAHFVYNSWQGAMVRAKAAGSGDPLEACLKTIFGRVLA